MRKLIFDLDGVIIVYAKNFAETYSEQFGISSEEIYKFFRDDYYDCAVGKSNLSDKIEKYIQPWGWTGSVEDLIQYWFSCQSKVDVRLLESIQKARCFGHQCYIASDADAMRLEFVKKLIDLDIIFNGCFFSCEMGVVKTEIEFFNQVIKALRCQPEQVSFWDDNAANVNLARSIGITAELYTGYEQFSSSFERLYS